MTEQLPHNTTHLPVRLRVEDYELLSSSGALDPYRKTELIDGEVLFMNAQHRAHMRIKSELAYRIRRALEAEGNSLFVGTEGSIAMPPRDEPEPDIVLTSEPHGDGAIPLASVTLVVEVSDTTQAFDLGRKARMYAHHRVPEYWVVDVERRSVRVLHQPGEGGYERGEDRPFGEVVVAATIAGLSVETNGL